MCKIHLLKLHKLASNIEHASQTQNMVMLKVKMIQKQVWVKKEFPPTFSNSKCNDH